MNNVFAHPRDFAATVLDLRPHPEADEHRPLDPLALPLVRTQHADGPTTPNARPPWVPTTRIQYPDPEALMRRREQAARDERLAQRQAQARTDLEADRRAARTAVIRAARESGEQQGYVAGWRAGFRYAVFAGVLIGAILGTAATRFALTGGAA